MCAIIFLAAGKSELTVLAERFKQQFCTVAESIGKDLNLNDVAQSLQVSRRRLYDIVNVLEALQVGLRAPSELVLYLVQVHIRGWIHNNTCQPS